MRPNCALISALTYTFGGVNLRSVIDWSHLIVGYKTVLSFDTLFAYPYIQSNIFSLYFSLFFYWLHSTIALTLTTDSLHSLFLRLKWFDSRYETEISFRLVFVSEPNPKCISFLDCDSVLALHNSTLICFMSRKSLELLFCCTREWVSKSAKLSSISTIISMPLMPFSFAFNRQTNRIHLCIRLCKRSQFSSVSITSMFYIFYTCL